MIFYSILLPKFYTPNIIMGREDDAPEYLGCFVTYA